MYKTIVVDDEKKHLERNVELLGQHDGFEVLHSYSNPAKALEEISQFKPDLLCVDLMMPILDGLELSQKIKEKLPDIKIVMISSSDPSMLPLDIIGIHEFVTKPLTMDKVNQIHENLEEI